MKTITKTATALLSGAALVIMAAAALPSMANAGTSCADAQTNGLVIGGIAGGALGNSVSGHNRGAGTLIGALLGAAVGDAVGQSSQSCTYQPRPVAYQPVAYQPAGYVTRTETVYTPAPPPPPAPVYVEPARYDADGPGNGGGIYPQFAGREDHIRREIVSSARDGDFSWDDAHSLLGRLDGIQAEERREFSYHGWNLPYDDQDRLNAQLDRLDRSVDWMRANG